MVALCFVEGGNLHYRSTDETRNIEETKRAKIKIDRTPPVARVGFDTDTPSIIVSGSDEQSEVTIEQREEDISPKRKSWRSVFSWIPDRVRNDQTKIRVRTILTDEAGHTTDIAFTEERKFGTSFALSDFLIGQDGYALDASRLYASYHAIPGRWGRDFAFLSSFLKTDQGIAHSRYFGRRDKTWIVSILEEVVRRKWRGGLVIPILEIGDNEIKIIWN